MKKRRLIVIIVLLILMLAVIFAAILYLYYKGGQDEREYETQLEVYKGIKPQEDETDVNYLADCLEINSDTVAWITIPDTEIDFPVVQGEDNSYYLNHSFEKESSSLGVPFLDYRCSGDFTDFNSIIYGHHIKGGMMFSGLDKYKEEDYFLSHSTGYLTTRDMRYTIHFVACIVSESDGACYTVVFLNDEEKQAYLDEITSNALILNDFSIDELIEKQLITLSTCSYEFEDARTVLIGWLE